MCVYVNIISTCFIENINICQHLYRNVKQIYIGKDFWLVNHNWIKDVIVKNFFEQNVHNNILSLS